MARLLRGIASLGKGIFRSLSFVRSLVFNLLFLALILFIVFSYFRSEEITIADNSILALTISGDVVEQRSDIDPFGSVVSELVGFPGRPMETLLQDILDAIDHAAEDPKIAGLLLDLDAMGMVGMNQLESIAEALTRFRQSGKPVLSAEDFYTQDQYYLAAHADTVFLNPMGAVSLNGFGLYRFYFKDALDKLQVDFHVFQVGSYKSALEPLTRNSMSAEDRFQSRAWLSALWRNYVEAVAEQRSLDPAAVNDYINGIPANLEATGGDLGQLALNYGLIDELKTRQEVIRHLMTIVDATHPDDIDTVPLRRYVDTLEPSYPTSSSGRDQIALIVAQGAIMPGESAPGTIGAESVAALLRRAKERAEVKGVVLRIDSGGGSAFASELIRQELLEVQKAGKPVFVSMGTYAASGAYWLAADAAKIWASPSTLTGSIGIFMALPTFKDALERGGIYRDGVGTTNLSAALDLSQPLAPEVSEAIQLTLENGYEQFLSIVAGGRGLPPEAVEQLANGRVYDGAAALELGLVDELGALADAVRGAAEATGLTDYDVVTMTTALPLRERLFQRIGVEAAALAMRFPLLATLLGDPFVGAARFPGVFRFGDPNGIYAHCMMDYR